MSEDFKPGTRPLLRIAGLDDVRPFISRDEEGNALWMAALALLMRMHFVPDAETRRDTGPSDAQAIAALRASLAENFGLEAADYLSWALIQYGCRQAPTLASLHPWERLMFEWQQRRASMPRIALMLLDAGLDRPLTPASLEAVDGWITNPANALGYASNIVSALFGARLVSHAPQDDGQAPAHDQLFRSLVESVAQPPVVSATRQRLESGPNGMRWLLEYTHRGVEHSFEAVSKGDALDIDAVMAGVDEFMSRLLRPERVFRLSPGRAGNGKVLLFLVADGARFAEIAFRLRFPLLRSPNGIELPGAGSIPLSPQREAAPSAPSRHGPPAPPALDSDPAMRSLISSLRRSFGAGRMLQASRWVKQAHVDPPAWLAASNDPTRMFYDHQEVLLRKGRLVWGAVVEADEAMYAPGIGDLPALLVCSADDYFDGRPAELRAVASRLIELRNRRSPGSSEASRFGQLVRNDAGRPLDLPVPAAFSSRGVSLTSVMLIRAHLPAGFLAADWLPVLTHEASAVPMVLPFMFWPTGFRTAWDEGRLRAPRLQGPAG